jgi:hypothetical protein
VRRKDSEGGEAMSDFRFGDDYSLNVLTPGAVDYLGEVDWDKVESVEIECDVYVKERITTRNGKFKTKYGRKVPLCECCGYSIGDDRYNYCPKCGATVVER